ncbi:hypothetical protein SAMN02910263_02520 [Butyrivibrio sp. INlla16]|nr:hypothetical protein SAMN02910263_02520 [Butyrivibrio sp. INlla16]
MIEDGLFEKEVSEAVMEYVQLRTEKAENLTCARVMMKRAGIMFDAEMIVLLDADLKMKKWTPSYWFNLLTDMWMGPNLFKEMEQTDDFLKWVRALIDKNEICIIKGEDMEAHLDIEKEQYRRLKVESVIGIPFVKHLTGFLVIKNPKRFIRNTAFAYVLADWIETFIYEYRKEMEQDPNDDPDEVMENPVPSVDEINVKLFGDMTIKYGNEKVIPASRLTARKKHIGAILAALFFAPDRRLSQQELMKVLYENPQDNDF